MTRKKLVKKETIQRNLLILRDLAYGFTKEEIATKHRIKENNVNNIVSDIYRYLELSYATVPYAYRIARERKEYDFLESNPS